MKPRTVYTIGYSQKNAAMTLQQLVEWRVKIIDIRLKPYSRWNPQWNKNALIARYGDYGQSRRIAQDSESITIAEGHYCHIEDLGNLAYLEKLGNIRLKNPNAGIPLVLSFLETYDIVLLCACRLWSLCHRHEVARLLLQARPDLRVFHIDEEHNVRSTWINGEMVNEWTQEAMILEEV